MESGFNKQQGQFLVNGFRNSFDIGYRGPLKRNNKSCNIPIKVGTLDDMWSKIMKEVQLGRHAGPFSEIPYDSYMQSPLGHIPKAGRQTRLIFHLSYDFGTQEDRKSLNFHTPADMCSVKYNDLDYGIRTCLDLVRKSDCHDGEDEAGTSGDSREADFKDEITDHVMSTIFLAKSDLKSAFKILPILPSQRKFLVMKCASPQTGKTMYLVEKCLPFGTSLSCARFQLFSESLRNLVEFATQCHFQVTNYLDDFLFISTSEEETNDMVRKFMELCNRMGCPISMDKMEWAASAIIFLGILLNGRIHTLSIPENKRVKALGMIDWALAKKKVTVKFIQQPTGTLNFINRAIVPGRAFTKRMYEKLRLRKASDGSLLKQFHHVSLNNSFLEDCKIWRQFLCQVTPTELRRPFIDINQFAEATTLNFFSDASLNSKLGMGAVFGNSWIIGMWGEKFIIEESPSIEFLELFALVAAVLTWGHAPELCNTRVIIYCNNQSTQQMVNSLGSQCPQCMKLRILTLNNLQFNRRIFVKWVKSGDNILADALSCGDMACFWRNAPASMNKKPNTIPDVIWPVMKIWYDNL